MGGVGRCGYQMVRLEDGVRRVMAERGVPTGVLLTSIGEQSRRVDDDADLDGGIVVREASVGERAGEIADQRMERRLIGPRTNQNLHTALRRCIGGAGHHAREGELDMLLNRDLRYPRKGERG